MNFRRYYVPNAIVFITQVVQGRRHVFRNEAHLELLLRTLRRVKSLYALAQAQFHQGVQAGYRLHRPYELLADALLGSHYPR